MHTGVGFYGKDASAGGSSNVHLSGFAIEGDVRERIDTDQVNGIGGALSNSTIDGLYIQHTKVGMWFDGPMTNLKITNNVIVDQIADGINFHTGVTNSIVSNNFIRNTGDDGLAMWSEKTADANNTFDHNTVQTPVLANGIAIYGGTDNTVSNNLIADPIREGSGIQVGSRFGAEPFTGHLWITDNTTVRAGTYELNWNIGLGAIWIYALEKNIDADIQVVGDNFLDNTYNAIMLVADFPVKDLYSITNVHFKDIKVDGTGTSVVSARAAGSATFENVDARNVGAVGVNNCGSFHFTAGRLGVLADRPRRQRRRRHHRARGSPRGSCRTPSPATTARRSSRRRRRPRGDALRSAPATGPTAALRPECPAAAATWLIASPKPGGHRFSRLALRNQRVRGRDLGAGLDGQAGQDAVEPAGEGPVGRADEVHEGGDQQAADDQGVDEDGEAEAEAEFLQDPLAAEQERPEDQDHDAGRGRDDLAALGLAGGDRLVVAPGGPAAKGGQLTVGRVVQVVPFLLDPADQVHLVVHGQPEQHGEQQDRDERVDRPGPGQARGSSCPSPS